MTWPWPDSTKRIQELEQQVEQLKTALQAALAAPPTIPDSALSGMASIPDKPEPERALVTELEILRRGWERDAIVIYAQETVREADGSTTWMDNECRTEHDTLRRCIAELAALTQPTPEPERKAQLAQAGAGRRAGSTPRSPT